MLFNSYIFVLLFLPLCLTGYFLLNHFRLYKLSQLFLLGMSLWFYGFFNTSYLSIIVVSIVINYGFSTLLLHTESNFLKKIAFVCALMLNVGILFYFKYFDFFIENVNGIFKTDFALKNILLPLGISFFTFQQLSYIIDSYKGEVPQYDFIQYSSFVVYFPQLIAGPIVTHDELVPQFLDKEKKKLNWENLAKGGYIFVLGLAKKVLLADIFGNAANWGFSNVEALNSTNAILTMLAYTIQIYFDFSGYCDMAIGIGKMMNIDLPLNFNSPYKAFTIKEFWDRWHMTLTRFFTKYVYIPLGGSKKGKIRTYLNVLIVFAVSGLWHGANWTFILWGLLHGLGSIITRHFKPQFTKMHAALSWMITVSFINITWILFRANSIVDAVDIINRIICCDFGQIASGILDAFNLSEFIVFTILMPELEQMPYVFMLIYFAVAFGLVLGSKNAYEKMLDFKPTMIKICGCTILLIWSIISFSGMSTFLYFNF